MSNTDSPLDDLKEQLAAIEHERWADWQKWMYSVLHRSGELTEGVDEILQRWNKQVDTPYKKLSRKEQLSDLEQVDRYWPLIIAWSDRRVREELVEQAIPAIIALLEKRLPEKKYGGGIRHNQFYRGYNKAINDVRKELLG